MSDQEILTDPARELVELCESLQSNTPTRGDEYLAGEFNVSKWSREFYQIIFTIIERCDLVKSIIEDLGIDVDYKSEIINDVSVIMTAFSTDSLKAGWNQVGLTKIGKLTLGPVKAISSLVRQKISYRKLSHEEVAETLEQVSELRSWLDERQLAQQDFIRQSLIEGLDHLTFRIERVQWLGWGYTLDSLREVIAAYLMLERGGTNPIDNPDAEAVLKKVGALIKWVTARVQTAKSAAETTDWLLRAYAAGSLIYQGKPVVTALLGSGA